MPTYTRFSVTSPPGLLQVGEMNQFIFNPQNGVVFKRTRLADIIVGNGKIVGGKPGPLWGDHPTIAYDIEVKFEMEP